ncbi:MAG: molybdopterin molybdotransferase MoeA [Comamonadaceae bacterium]|nr:molybdopterin molybdotransferase MoeA [Comamonadaceae bacterium]
MSDLLDYHDALATLLQTHTPLPSEEAVPLAQLHQRVLAREVRVQHDVPAFDNSAMDGYAICGNDCQSWQVVQRIAAGDAGAQQRLAPGQAARIFTGAPVPQGATAVLMQEHVEREDAEGAPPCIRLRPGADGARPAVAEGQNIRRQAEELRAGAPLLAAHQRLTPAAIGLLAAQGYAQAPCVPQLRVTVFSSGNELAEPGQPLREGQIYDSNRLMLLNWLRALGFAATDGGILPDQLAPTQAALAQAARTADAILCSGGVSVGEEDYLKTALSAVGELIHWRLFIKPGKPFTWGHIPQEGGRLCRVFMLPGNPVSSLVTFQQLALPALQRLAGLPEAQARPWHLQAKAAFTRQKAEARREFLRVNLQSQADGYHVQPLGQQGSAMLSGAAFAQALAEIPPGMRIEPGQMLTVYPLTERF